MSGEECECVIVGDMRATTRCRVHNPFLRDTADLAHRLAHIAALAYADEHGLAIPGEEVPPVTSTACPNCKCDPYDKTTLGTHGAAACINPQCPAGCHEPEVGDHEQ